MEPFSEHKLQWNHYGMKYKLAFSKEEMDVLDLFDVFMRKITSERPDFDGFLAYNDLGGRQIIIRNDADLRGAIEHLENKLKIYSTVTEKGEMAASNTARPERCLCGLMDVTTGTAVLGGLTIIGGALGIIFQLQNTGKDSPGHGVIAVVLVLRLLTCMIGGVTVLAVVKEKHKLLWPFIVVQWCGVILIFLRALAVIFLYILFAVEIDGLNELEKRDATPGDIVLGHAIFCIATTVHIVLILLLIWFARTAKRCLEFFKAKNEATDQLKSREGVHRSLVLDA